MPDLPTKKCLGFDVVAAVPTAITDEPEAARARLRGDLIPYFSLPFYRAMIERSGFGDDIAGFDDGMAKGDPKAAVGAISDRFLQTLAAVGSGDEAEATIRRYLDAGATSPCLGGVPGTGASNVHVEPGPIDPDGLMADVRRGLYVTEMIGHGVNPVTGDFSRGASGFLIENGRLGAPVAEITIAGNLIDMFRALVAANDLEFRRGVNVPTLRIDGMTVAGA